MAKKKVTKRSRPKLKIGARARKAAKTVRSKAKARVGKARTRVKAAGKKAASKVRSRAGKTGSRVKAVVKKATSKARTATKSRASKAGTKARAAVKKAGAKARARAKQEVKKRGPAVLKAVKKARARAQKAVIDAMEPVKVRKTMKVKDPKERAFEPGPGFHNETHYRPSNITENGLQFVGHSVSDDGKAFNQYLHYDQLYIIRHGQNSKFFIGCLEGKIIGTKCPNCWNLDCDLQETDWVEFPLRAKVHTWTVAGWSGRSSLKRLPIVLVYAKIEGSTVAIANELHGIDPWDVEFDMDLEVEFIPKEERTGSVTDFHFVPAKSWKPGPMTPEKERIKELVQPVYEWVRSMK
jgi:uncharacterized OB-fold protein